MPTAIEFDNVGKQYRLGLVSTQTLSHDLHRWWTVSVRGKEDPYLKIGETNDRSVKGSSDYVWALKDISFKVEQGDVVGIIGRNGAGKSTLLKLLSKVTGPTTGQIRARGRIGSLLEVGTGFHPEMTGRENIFMNGAILGMSKAEIASKLDEIVDFSGCERYLDTPVKRYSSGMMVRLGFAVAAHLDPEILVVDEVLAVGDAEFQKKAIGKMKDVSQGQGRTVLFVSHNMGAVRSLCKNGIVLKNGTVDYVGTADECVDYYLRNQIADFEQKVAISTQHRLAKLDKEIEFLEISIDNDSQHMASDEPIVLNLQMKINDATVKHFTIGYHIQNLQEQTVGTWVSPVYNVPDSKDGKFCVRMVIKGHNLAKGKYTTRFNVGIKDLSYGNRDYDIIHNVINFEIINRSENTPFAFWYNNWGSILHQDVTMEIQ